MTNKDMEDAANRLLEWFCNEFMPWQEDHFWFFNRLAGALWGFMSEKPLLFITCVLSVIAAYFGLMDLLTLLD